MELKQLRYFLAVAEEGHITRAAERLDIQQPPLSRQIKAIERELDVQLFRRKARGVELTDAGRALLDKGRKIISDLDHAIDATRSTARGEQGRLCVGVTPSGPFHPFLPRAIRSFREAFPLVSLTLEEWPSSELIEQLEDERLDVAFVRTSLHAPESLVVTPLLNERMVVALPDGHALARAGKSEAIALKRLAGEIFVLYSPGSEMYDATIAACRASGFSPHVGQQTPRIVSALALVATGFGISLVPASMQRMHLEGIAYLAIVGAAQPTARLSIAWRRAAPSAVVQKFLKLVRNTARLRDLKDARIS